MCPDHPFIGPKMRLQRLGAGTGYGRAALGSIVNLSPTPALMLRHCKRSQAGRAPMKCEEGFAFAAEACGSGAGISHEATRGAVQARRAQLQLGRQFSVMFLLGGFHMPMVSRGRIHACEVLLLSPSLCVILSLSCI